MTTCSFPNEGVVGVFGCREFGWGSKEELIQQWMNDSATKSKLLDPSLKAATVAGVDGAWVAVLSPSTGDLMGGVLLNPQVHHDGCFTGSWYDCNGMTSHQQGRGTAADSLLWCGPHLCQHLLNLLAGLFTAHMWVLGFLLVVVYRLAMEVAFMVS
ncbi:hypothetical protein CBR_g6650 [Chara braunii]|nr:hypothetical protein CBR_g6650 [Chara braunii]|eukprot:GBG70523.1 hypothetical protein CBR_g6650 [Chara braunii]